MTRTQRAILLGAVVAVITLSIIYLESRRPQRLTPGESDVQIADVTERTTQKSGRYSPAKEISTPDAFINSDEFQLADLIGEKVILVDFWTYSCINCRRTTPFLNDWHDKYVDDGLVIVGIHTPEFEFEKDFDNVLQATQELGIEFPVVLDNDYSTWRSYENRYWPRKYLIDIDGYIIYDHIGEGGYEETEREIRRALEERSAVLNQPVDLSSGDLAGRDNSVNFADVNSPEIYFGASRNKTLANGESYRAGRQTLSLPTSIKLNELYLAGDWNFTEEAAQNLSEDARISFRFSAKNVYMVLGADQQTTVRVLLDGQLVTNDTAGSDIVDGIMQVAAERLYHLISLDESGMHSLEIIIEQPGLEAFTFTFG